MSSRKQGRPKNKNHAQDCGTLIGSEDQRPAILPWFLHFGWRPSFREVTGSLPVGPSGRIAAGPVFEHDPIGKPVLAFPDRTLAHEHLAKAGRAGLRNTMQKRALT